MGLSWPPGNGAAHHRIRHSCTSSRTFTSPDGLTAAEPELDGRLRLAVQLVEETQLLSGDGTGSNLTGLLNRTGLQTIALAAPAANTTNPSIAEVIYQAITNVRVNA